MKFLLFFLLALLVGCQEDGVKPKPRFDQTPDGRRKLVVFELETEEVAELPGDSYKFFARTKDGTVWFVEVHQDKIYKKHPMLIEKIIQAKI